LNELKSFYIFLKIQFGNVERQRMQAIREQLEEEMNKKYIF